LWGGCYRELIQDLKKRGAWFATANRATVWFRKRRSAAFESDPGVAAAVRAKVGTDQGEHVPGLRLRIHKAADLGKIGAHRSEDFVDVAVDENVDASVPSEARR